ncbi:hypothetical protein Y033_5379 [Burkholderia pseudomallei MSHR435]|nr:hypothetical protein Y033_5379 [Burkholderia pseudomallei MSHR435]
MLERSSAGTMRVQHRAKLREQLAERLVAARAVRVLARHHVLDGDAADVVAEQRARLGECRLGQRRHVDAACVRRLHQLADDPMRFAKRHALADQVVRVLGGDDVPAERRLAHPVGHGRHRANQLGQDRERRHAVVERGEPRGLVLLQILVVAERQRLQERHQAHRVADHRRRLAAHELRHVGVLLLRHDRAAGAVAVRERDEAELLARERNELLRQPRQMDHQIRRVRAEFDEVVAVGHRIDAVQRGLPEAQPRRRAPAVDRQARAGRRTGAERALVGARERVDEAAAVALEHHHVSREPVRVIREFGALQVRVRWHHERVVALAVLEDRALQRVDRVHQLARRAHEIEALRARLLIVAAARGMRFLAELAELVDQQRLEVHVDVLERGRQPDLARAPRGADLVERARERLVLRRLQQARRMQHLDVRGRAVDVGLEEPRLERQARVERHQAVGHRLAEASGPRIRHRIAHAPAPVFPARAASMPIRRPSVFRKPVASSPLIARPACSVTSSRE